MKILCKIIMPLMALAVLGGCSSFKKTPPPCPRISILADAAEMTKFRENGGRDLTDVELMAEIQSYRGYCTYDLESEQMTVTLQVGLNAKRGPAIEGNSSSLSYFVAMPVFYPKDEAKRVVPMKIDFPEGVSGIQVTDDELFITFPLHDFDKIDAYEIFLGLQLDRDQLDYNRIVKERR